MSGRPDSIEFLGWDRPALHVAAEWLAGISSRRAELDLSRVAVIVPGSRAGRSLLSLLTQHAARGPVPFCPPTIATPGEIPELALGPFPGVAGDVAVLMAWMHALKDLDVATFASLAGERPPADAVSRWLGLADMLMRCESHLAAAGLTMADVSAGGSSFGSGFPQQRWDAAAKAQTARDELLASKGLTERHAARRRTLTERRVGSPRFDRIVLVGLAEMAPVSRQAIVVSRIPVTVLVHGREQDRDLLDDWGMPRVDSAQLIDVRVDRGSIVFADSPRDQAHESLAAALEGGPACDETALCIADESLTSVTARVAAEAGIAVHLGAGTPLQHSRIWRLVTAIRRHMAENTIETLRAIARQPDMERLLDIRGGVLARLDEYAEQTLHQSLSEAWREESRSYAAPIEAIDRRLRELLGPLREATGDEAADELLALLANILSDDADHPADLHDRDLRAFKAFRDVVDSCRGSDARAMLKGVPSIDVLGLMLRAAARVSVPDEACHPSLELIGWLEAALDPSPRMAVSGFNEGIVPGASSPDPLLTESMRAQLGLPCTATRLARDAWLLRTLEGSKRSLTLICGRRSVDGDPLRPSRFLLAADAEQLPGRILEAMGKVSGPPRRQVRLRARESSADRFCVPVKAPAPVAHDDRFSVTSFRTYLASPYQFYLLHVLRLSEAVAPGREASPATFGDLVHLAIRAFSEDRPMRSVTDAARIEEALLASLDREAAKAFGPTPSPATALQLEVARRRLRTFSRWQAERTAAGWIILEAEWTPPETSVAFVVDGKAASLRGKIDRIERHASDGRLAIIDFKTGDEPRTPAAAYARKSGTWMDLQLPLYRHLAASLGGGDDSVLGYMNIPAKAEQTKLLEAGWDASMLLAADETARDVIRRVRTGAFDEVGTIGAYNPIHAAMSGHGLESEMQEEGE